jgi:hypothetical protein
MEPLITGGTMTMVPLLVEVAVVDPLWTWETTLQ